MRRRAIIASALLILAGAWWHPARAATEIAFGITSQTAFSLAHYVAIEKKLYEAENLKVDTFVAGSAIFGKPDYAGIIKAMREQIAIGETTAD